MRRTQRLPGSSRQAHSLVQDAHDADALIVLIVLIVTKLQEDISVHPLGAVHGLPLKHTQQCLAAPQPGQFIKHRRPESVSINIGVGMNQSASHSNNCCPSNIR